MGERNGAVPTAGELIAQKVADRIRDLTQLPPIMQGAGVVAIQADLRAAIDLALAAAEPARGEVETIRELSAENPAQPLRGYIKQLSECGEGLVSIDGEVYWINAEDRGVLRTALALWAGPRACEDGALVSRAARALSATAPRHAELLRDLAARLGFGGGDDAPDRETATLTERLGNNNGGEHAE